jgi:predicted enzyme related to lactoylglutathione lyase
MAVIKIHKPGVFCWTDLGTTDVAASKKFYRSVFGATITDFPMGPGNEKYSILRVKGKDVCGIYPMSAEQKKMKAPPAWLPYISVASANAGAKKAKSAGGKIVAKPMDVGDVGRMAVVADPTGAMFALWQAGTRRGAQLDDTPGTVGWHDLNTMNPPVAGKFYSKVFGWKSVDQDYSGNAYHLFKLGRTNVCGMWPFPMKKLGPSWLTYWQVSDCAKTVSKVKRLGGRALMGTTIVPGMARFAVLKDPQGAAFGVLEPARRQRFSTLL